MKRREVLAFLGAALAAWPAAAHAHSYGGRMFGGREDRSAYSLAMEDTMEQRKIELHFQEGFEGEQIEILRNGTVAAAFPAKTRYQISLAHIEELAIAENDEVVIRIKGGAMKIVPLVNGITQYRVNLVDNSLQVEPARDRQTYM